MIPSKSIGSEDQHDPGSDCDVTGNVLGATEGEHLVHWRDVGNIFIEVGPATGSAIWPLEPSRCRSVPAFRYTDTCAWTKPSTFWQAAEFSH